MTEQIFTTIVTGGTAGVIATLLTAVILLVRGDVVPKYIYKALEAKLTRYEELAYKAMTALEHASKTGGAG